ncbi:hypothetical protein ACIA8C_03425 [Nocardia sp. NPDC051321]|uniref:hypothetical protein n=1 Tax=Nocardia sp. NPDC051321 TaxID=3364323 RepID=UPI0037B86CCB
MTAAHNEYEEVHRLVDHLSANQVRRLRLLVADDPELGKIAGALAEAHTDQASDISKPRRRSLGFIGTLEAEPDLAERSAEIVREGLGGTE